MATITISPSLQLPMQLPTQQKPQVDPALINARNVLNAQAERFAFFYTRLWWTIFALELTVFLCLLGVSFYQKYFTDYNQTWLVYLPAIFSIVSLVSLVMTGSMIRAYLTKDAASMRFLTFSFGLFVTISIFVCFFSWFSLIYLLTHLYFTIECFRYERIFFELSTVNHRIAAFNSSN
jgi:hypothetical protein